MTQITHIPAAAIESVLSADVAAERKAALFADICRYNVIAMIQTAGSGHYGTSLSSLDIMSWLYLVQMTENDVFFSSKGHDAPAIYAVLIGLGKLPFDKLHTLRRLGGLPGHPDVRTDHMVTNTGSLGMGIAKARGMAKAARLNGEQKRFYVLLGDGELQEGQIYESLQPTANQGYGEIVCIVDHNKIQSDTWVAEVSDLGALQEKFAVFGWAVDRCDGNDIEAFKAALERLDAFPDKPKMLIADTVKGKGVSFMETFDAKATDGQYAYHSGAMSPEMAAKACEEVLARLNGNLESAGLPCLTEGDLATRQAPEGVALPDNVHKLVAAYGEQLLELGGKRNDMVVLDADLAKDCGIIPFRNTYPDRFVECGIAEQDMVSMAGGLALSGKLPVVHSFACFLSTRPNEHIFNNATEHTKVIYAGSLAGILPSGPGHSHQCVRDISSLGGVPGLVMVEPCCEAEAKMLLTWCVEENCASSYIRLITIPCPVSYELPAGYTVTKGQGCTLYGEGGSEIVILTYGALMGEQAVQAARLLEGKGKTVTVVNMPFLNTVDDAWLAQSVDKAKLVVTVDNHLLKGGQGELLAASLMRSGSDVSLVSFGLEETPACGQNAEVLKHHALDGASIAERILAV